MVSSLFRPLPAACSGKPLAGVCEHVTPRTQERMPSVLGIRWAGSAASLTDAERERLPTMAPVPEDHYKEATKGGLLGSPCQAISHLRDKGRLRPARTAA